VRTSRRRLGFEERERVLDLLAFRERSYTGLRQLQSLLYLRAILS
jgi:hypothetical protein